MQYASPVIPARNSTLSRRKFSSKPGPSGFGISAERQIEPDMQLSQSFGQKRCRRLHQKVPRLLVHRKGDHFANVRCIGQKPDDAVNAGSQTAMRWGAI